MWGDRHSTHVVSTTLYYLSHVGTRRRSTPPLCSPSVLLEPANVAAAAASPDPPPPTEEDAPKKKDLTNDLAAKIVKSQYSEEYAKRILANLKSLVRPRSDPWPRAEA